VKPPGQRTEERGHGHEPGPDKGFGRSVRGAGADRTDSQANTNQYEPGRNSPTAGADTRSTGGAVPEDRTGAGTDRRGIQQANDRNQAERERTRRSIRPIPAANAEGHNRGQAGGNTVRKRGGTMQQAGRGSQPGTIEDNIERRGLSEARREVIDRVDTAGGAGVHNDLREVESRNQPPQVRELSRDLVDRGSGADRSHTRGDLSIATDPSATATDGISQP